jgi:hypothetical protein
MPRPELEDCVTIDIVDTPFPKTGIVKSLDLEVEQSKSINVALMDNQKLLVVPTMQEWERIPDDRFGCRTYRCKTLGGTTEFAFDDRFLVRFSPKRWRMTGGLVELGKPQFLAETG